MTQQQPQQEPAPKKSAAPEKTPEARPETPSSEPRVNGTTPHDGARNDGEDLSPDDFE